MKQWKILPGDQAEASRLAREYGVPELVGSLLYNRGFQTQEQIDQAFGKELSFSDPFLMADMDKAVERIQRAIENFEKIAVYGDYDADGVTSTAMLYSYLESCGANVMFYIPKREGEGYGMNQAAVSTLHEQEVNLIITVDNGIASIDEVAYASSLDMDVVVTDHHRLHEQLPQAYAIVDPCRPDCQSAYKHFSGVGVAFKLIMALEGEDCDLEGLLENYADLVAIGTIADVVPLTGENRSFVRAGIRQIARTDRFGLRALLDHAGLADKPINSGRVTFGIVPRINATGRMGSPDRAVQLLISEYPEEAEQLAADICDDNDYRKQIEAEIFQKAMEQLQSDPQRLKDRVLVVWGENWHHGVIGIVSSRITERFGKPSIVLSYNDEEAKGSGRSVEGFSLFEAVSACESYLTRFGGHPMAAGMTLPKENLESFRTSINQYAQEHCVFMPAPVLTLDAILEPADLRVELPDSLKLLEPFGMGNPSPVFGLLQMKLDEIVPVGGGKHLRLIISRNGYSIRCMRFGVAPEDFPYHPGDTLDFAVALDAKEFNGKNTLTIIVQDIKPSSLHVDEFLHSRAVYEKIQRGEPLDETEYTALSPSREDFAALYRFLRANNGFTGLEELLLCRAELQKQGIGKVLLELDVLEEYQLLSQKRFAGTLAVTLLKAEKKVDLFQSKQLSQLKAAIKGR